MSTLNKFIIFQCDTCNRQTELLIDSKRIDPIRCNITFKCRGKLSRVGESSNKNFLFSPPVAGLQDYIQRGTIIPGSPTVEVDPNIPLNTGEAILTTASLNKVWPNFYIGSNLVSTSVKLNLNIFPISSSLLKSSSYTYLKSGVVQVISGADDTPSSSVLRFETTNNLSVSVNGVLIDPVNYDRSVLNQITFTPAIYESNNLITIIVYNDLLVNVADENIVDLSFSVINDPTILSGCSWGNYDAVEIQGQTRYMMHCTDLSMLMPDIAYGIKGAQLIDSNIITVDNITPGYYYKIITIGDNYPISNFISIGAASNTAGTIFQANSISPLLDGSTGKVSQVIDVDLSEFNLLTAKDPYGFQDKELHAYLSGSLFNSSFSFTYSQDLLTGIYKLTALQSLFTQLTNILIPSISSSSNLTVSINGASTPATGLKHKYIIGPT